MSGIIFLEWTPWLPALNTKVLPGRNRLQETPGRGRNRHNQLSRSFHRFLRVARRHLKARVLPSHYSLILSQRMKQSEVDRHILRIKRLHSIGYRLQFLSGPSEITDEEGNVTWCRALGELSGYQKQTLQQVVSASGYQCAQCSFCASVPQVSQDLDS